MNPAQATRIEKEKHPERFCPDKKCLWRIRRLCMTPLESPCPKHMKAKPASLNEEADRLGGRKTELPHTLGSESYNSPEKL